MPVQFYTGWDYYVNGLKSLRNRSANMDVLIALGSSVEERIMKMKKHLSVLLVGLVIGWLASAAFAATGHDTHNTATDHMGHVGEKIHESALEGYRLAYHLLDLPGREAKHLITYIIDKTGKPVNDAKVGYLVVGPGGKEQTVMAMAMQDSFGGDVDFSLKGKYTIKAKAVIRNKSLLDSFTFVVD